MLWRTHRIDWLIHPLPKQRHRDDTRPLWSLMSRQACRKPEKKLYIVYLGGSTFYILIALSACIGRESNMEFYDCTEDTTGLQRR